MHKTYQELASLYDLMFQGRNYPREAEYVRKTVSELCPGARSLLDVGCGTGNHLKNLEDEFDVLCGVDLNKEILEAARRKTEKIEFHCSDMISFKLARRFDVLTCLFSVFNYNFTLDDAKKTLLNCKNHLNAGAVVILALYNPTNTKNEISMHMGRNKDVEVAKINQYRFDPESMTETTDFLVLTKTKQGIDFSVETGHKFHIFSYNEIEGLLAETGFKNVRIYDGYTDIPASASSKYPLVVAQLK